MLLTCPSCSMRYVVADASIGEAGRKVRCASCGHQWFQEGSAALDIAMEESAPPPPREIPEGVKPQADAPAPVLAADAQAMRDQDLIARVCGFFSAFLVFLFLFLMLALFKGPMVHSFPPSVMFYELIKLSPPVPGSGLVIDQLHAVDRGGELIVEGRIINLTDKEISVPPVAVFIVDDAGGVLETYPLVIGTDSLAGESEVDLYLAIPSPAAMAQTVRVGFNFPQ